MIIRRLFFLLFLTIIIFGLIRVAGHDQELQPIDLTTDDSSLHSKRNFTIIVPFAAGGGTDLIARALAKASEKHLDHPITVVNRIGGGGSLGLLEGASAKTDGFTLTMIVTELVTLPHFELLPIHYKDFKPILLFNSDPAVITVRADSPWKSINQFLDYTTKNPGKLKMGSSGIGSIGYLSTTTIEKLGMQFDHILFEGAAPAVSALLRGHVDAVSVSAAEIKAFVEAGDLSTLAILSDKALSALPDVKTIAAETGYTLHFYEAWKGIGVPKGTPEDITHALEEAFTKGIEEAEFKEFMKDNGYSLFIKRNKAFEQHLKEQNVWLGNLISNLKP